MAGYGLGAGLGSLFRSKGRQQLTDAQMQLYGQQIAQKNALDQAAIQKDNASAALDQNQLGALDPNTIAQTAMAMGATPQQAAQYSLMMRGAKGAAPDSTVKALASLGTMFAGNAANPQGADAFARALGQDTTKVADGVVYDPVASTSQQIGVTPVGQAGIADKQSSIAEHFAQAARARAGIGADKAGNYDILPTANGFVRVNKLTNSASPVMNGATPVMPQAKGGGISADDSAYLSKLRAAAASGVPYAKLAAAAQQDGRAYLLKKYFGTQDDSDGADDGQ